MAPVNGAQSSEGPYYYGDVVTYSCDEGYELDGASSVTCQADQTWSEPVPTCQRVECPYRMAPENGAQSSEGPYYYGDVVTYTCGEGYGLNGASSVTCQADQTWTDDVPTCQLFDYAVATSAITDSPLDPAVAEEIGLEPFLNDLAAYAEYDGTPLADLPNTDNIIIMPERLALTYTDPETGIRTGMFLPETKNFDPDVPLPDELPSIVITALMEMYPIYYEQYLSNMASTYSNLRATTEFDIATYGPECPYPVRTELGGGFALEPIAPSLCRPVDKIEERDEGSGRTVKLVISGEIIVQPLTADGRPSPDEFAFEVDLSYCDCSTEPPSDPPCTVVTCNSAAPFNNGDTCTYLCSGECSGASTTVTCIDGVWDGEVAVCEIRCPPEPPLPRVFDYAVATNAITGSTLDPVVAEEIGLNSFLNDLTAYAEYDGTPLADLPNTDNIIIMPERLALTYTDPQTGIRTGMFLPETKNFDPDVPLPDELPSIVITALMEMYPIYYEQYLSNMAATYSNLRATTEFDIATYGPECPIPVRTELGGGFALEPIAPSLCRPVNKIEEIDDGSGDCSTEPPSDPPCTVVTCNSAAPFNNGDTCTYLCSGECSGASTTVTCRNGTWDGQVAVCEIMFDYGEATSAITGSTLDPAVAAEVGSDSFLTDLAAYAEYDGTPLADLPNTDNITIMPERLVLTYTNNGVTTGMFLPETRNFDPEVGLPDELPSVAITALRETYPLYYAQYLSNMEADYRNSRTDVEFDIATYGPDTNCTYPPRTDLGGGFALRRIAPTLCRPDDTFEAIDPVTDQPIKVVMGQDIVREQYIEEEQDFRDEAWVDVDLCGCLFPALPPSPTCVISTCTPGTYYPVGFTCEYQCGSGCTGTSTSTTCGTGGWIFPTLPACISGCMALAPPCMTTTCSPNVAYIPGSICIYECAPGCIGGYGNLTCVGLIGWVGSFAPCSVGGCFPPYPVLPDDFDYADATSAITSSTLDPAVAEEVGLGSFLNDLAAYAEYDGTPVADLPDTDNIVIMPERWALTYTNNGITTGMFLPETRNFDPAVGLPDELPSVAITALRDRYPLYYEQYLSNMEADYRNSRTDVEFDSATFGPDTNCSYPPRTDLGGGFALRRIAPTLCQPDERIVATDPVTNQPIKVRTGRDIVREQFIEEEQDFRDEAWVDVEVSLCDCLAPPSYPCIDVVCAPGPYFNGDTCGYTCARGCSGVISTIVTCNNGIWDGTVPICNADCPPLPSIPPCTVALCFSPAPYQHGDTCGYTCAPGCIGFISTILTCNDGSWDGIVPYCTKKLCPLNYELAMGRGPCLRFSEDRQSYQDASQTCRDEGGRLVVIKSAALDAFIDNRIQTTYNAETWIGLDDLTPPPSQYVWSDGSVLGPGDFNDWSPGQPDTLYGEECVEIRPWSPFNYRWNNHHCWRLKHYICESCPPTSPLPWVFDYEAATIAITGSTLDPAVAEEIGLDSFLNDLAAYADYDGTPLADLPDTENIIIMPERWALTYTNAGCTTALFLDETRNFNPDVGLPDELPSFAIAALRERYPLYYEQYLFNMETEYRNSRNAMEFDITTYGPDSDCPYPLRTNLGGGFALERIPPTLCQPDEKIETRDPDTDEVIKVVTGIDLVPQQTEDGLWVDVAVFPRCDCLTGPADIPPCIEVLCFSPPPYNNGDTCAYTCKPECIAPGSTSNILTCNNGDWVGEVPDCPLMGCPSRPNFYCTTVTDCSAPYLNGETCTYTCNDTCVGNPSTMTRTCLEGSWYGEDWAGCYIILRLGCDALPPTFPCTTRTCTGTDHGDVCTYECDRGCTGVPSTMVRTCEDGEWVGEPWRGCQQNCDRPPSFPCALRLGCASPYTDGETCAYWCNRRRGCAGIPATTTRICRDGVWVGPDWNGCHKGNP
ncbi:PREDICTED: uncharacterized protein LOC109462620 [Branchiostoma belcheri]|uniref:Uncharacterized protein LOC109462620 n=1 Tax=Branchiostoma belcheri TaxID=7741 RepID=A0A6P4Y7L2_BRABE|nr:PREDICTED: uncharacterized protein LOC109462620 [Branchiostoma belcheri]